MMTFALIAGLVLGAALFGCGMFLGWAAREKVAVARDEVSIPLVDAPLPRSVQVPMFVPADEPADA